MTDNARRMLQSLNSLAGLSLLLCFGAGPVFPANTGSSEVAIDNEIDKIISDNGQEIRVDLSDLRDALNNTSPETPVSAVAFDESDGADLGSKDLGMVAGAELEPKFSRFMKGKGYGRTLFEGHWHWADEAGKPLSADAVEDQFWLFLRSD